MAKPKPSPVPRWWQFAWPPPLLAVVVLVVPSFCQACSGFRASELRCTTEGIVLWATPVDWDEEVLVGLKADCSYCC